jgi:TRAP transporter TAXI family solute receptor
MKEKKFFLLALLSLAVLFTACSGKEAPSSASGGGAPANTPAPVQLRVGGAAQNSWAYSCMVAIAEAIRQTDPGMDLVIQATPGSTNHYPMLANDEIDMGTGFTPTDYWANIGEAPLFNKSYKDQFYVIAPITKSKTHVIVRADSPVKTLADLNGRRVYAGDQGGASTQMALRIIATLKLKVDAIQTGRAEGFEMLKDGRVDAIFQSQGVPYAAILELATAAKLRLLSFTDAEIATLTASGPYCFKGEIAPGAYDFVTEPVKTVSQQQNINVQAKMDNDLVYRLTKDIVENWPNVIKVIPGAASVDPKVDVTNTVTKIHPGAVRYYEERGVTIPANLK